METTHTPTIRSHYDTIVIGGGPAGSTFATVVADADRSVLVLEAAKFPRLAVGEIVAPTALWRVWHRLGITAEDLDERFIQKYNGAWQSEDGTVFQFEQDVFPEDEQCRAWVYSFERSVYDEYLLNNARDHGATALEEAFVQDILYSDDGRVNGVRFMHGGLTHEVRCDLLIDASGRGNFLARKLDLRMEMAELKSFACFAHFEGVKRNPGTAEGDVRLIFGKDMWFWWAPLKAPKASVGIVANREVFLEEYLEDPAAFYDKYVQTCDYIWDRIKDAERVTEFKPLKRDSNGEVMFSDYHAYAKELVGDGWAIIGDAAAFVDPIFSAGLYVAQSSAVALADEVIAAMDENDLRKERLQAYNERYWSDYVDVFSYIQRFATDYFEPKFVNFYLRLGNRHERIRQLYIDTFVTYDPTAIKEYGELVRKYFKDSDAPQEMQAMRKSYA
ncbi:MAG: tryptophan 7-halogenase [Rubricoccaceae bacterium]|nr:tryptophan 7-halogenase [Rubricoccaceae bacterium]